MLFGACLRHATCRSSSSNGQAIRFVFSLKTLFRRSAMDRDTFERLNTFPGGLKDRHGVRQHMACNYVVALDDPEREATRARMRRGELSPVEQRGLGVLFGMVCGDAMGAPMEFSSVRYGHADLTPAAAQQIPFHLWAADHYNTFRLKPGQWTDDASMGFCLADSLLMRPQFDPQDLRLRFLNWWAFGYNNAFGWDDGRGKGSVGLGGNISMSMGEFAREGTPYTRAGDRNTSGNGSVMRNAAVPLAFFRDLDRAVDVARKQSKTTHQGDEAAECCAVMTWLCARAMREPGIVSAKELLGLLPQFKSELYSVQCLVNSRQEERHASNASTADLADRNWNWQDPEYRYSPLRARQQPGYVGSYCMDALAMALHCVWSTDSFVDALLKIVNMRGDSDSTGSVCGQIAGAVYGVAAVPQLWIDTVEQWDGHGTIALRGVRLMQLFEQK
jgi:ADP-ribosyl-[dinitrogen reductase] hydrolase